MINYVTNRYKEKWKLSSRKEPNPLLILGDFNGHVGFLGSQQCDENRQMLLNWLDDYNLILLKSNPNCAGETTCSRRDQKSSIDFVLVNQKLYQNFYSMNIDEDNSAFDLSDHHMIEIQFQIPFKQKEKQKVTEVVSYLKISEDTTEDFKQMLEAHLKEKPSANIEELNTNMKHIADKVMRKTFRKKTEDRGETLQPIVVLITVLERKSVKDDNLTKRQEKQQMKTRV